MRIVCIGSGNLATNLTFAWKEAGILVEQVFSRTEANAKALAGLLGCAWTVSIEEIINDADLYLFSLKDSALETVASRLPENSGLWVHTAGSMPLSVFEPFTTRRGVIYPLQTFSKSRRVNLDNVPFFLEANLEKDGAILEQLARAVGAICTSRPCSLATSSTTSMPWRMISCVKKGSRSRSCSR